MNRTDRHDATRSDRPNSDRTMQNVSHTHPYADRGALANLFERGPVVAADGGKRESYDASEEEAPDEPRPDADEARMRDVDHTPPHDEGDGVNRVFERGGKEEPVESEE